MTEIANAYTHKGRLTAYIKDAQQVVSYPRVICAGEYGRKIQREHGYDIGSSKRKLTDEQVKHIGKNYIPKKQKVWRQGIGKKV